MHHVLSYPTPLIETVNPSKVEMDLREIVKKVRKIVNLKKKLTVEEGKQEDSSFITVGPKGSKHTVHELRQTVDSKIDRLVCRVETEKTFPALVKLLHMLRYGFSLSTSTATLFK